MRGYEVLQVNSPYAPKRVSLAQTGSEAPGNVSVPAGRINPRTGSVIESQSEALVGYNGELNAGSKTEILQAIAVLQKQMTAGKIKRTNVQASADRQKQHAKLVEAFHAQDNGKSWMAIGEVLGDEIWTTLGREGFARKVMMIRQLAQGEIGRLKVRRKDVVSYFVVSAPNVVASQVRQFYVYPPEFYIIANILMEDREIAQSPGDLLEDKYQDGLEQILKQEDVTWLNLARNAAAAANDLFFFNTFTPSVFSQMQIQVSRWGIPAVTSLLAFDLWNDIRTDSEFASYFDPVTKHELIMEGSLGSFFGVQLITDAFRHDTLRVLADGEVYMLGAPQTLGGMTVRKELATKNIDLYSQGRPERGWFMEEILGMSIVNSRAIVRGQRV